MILDSELQDFEAAIKSAGYGVEDFFHTAVVDERSPETQPITGTVTVKRKLSGEAKVYRAGYRSTWVAEFEQDLKRGLFGAP